MTFSGETASGWQQANLSTPVAITADTVYVVSYHAGNGHYSADSSYFVQGHDNAPLHALADGVLGPNGVFATARRVHSRTRVSRLRTIGLMRYFRHIAAPTFALTGTVTGLQPLGQL